MNIHAKYLRNQRFKFRLKSWAESKMLPWIDSADSMTIFQIPNNYQNLIWMLSKVNWLGEWFKPILTTML